MIYGLVLLLPSLVLTLAGGFTSLDRTGTVKDKHPDLKGPLYQAFEPPKRFSLHLSFQGGVGGTAAGLVFGSKLNRQPFANKFLPDITSSVHFVAFVTLAITNRTSLHPLTSIEFLMVWIIAAICLALVGASLRTLSLIFTACLGG